MIQIDTKENCCGCGACANICPTNSITMERDEEGFAYPVVDNSKCIKCGKCKGICPVLNYTRPSDDLKCAFIAQNKDAEVLRESTSGGFFTAIAEYVIENGGVVFGVCIDDNKKVKHIYVEKKEELYKFRNSKYVQSEIGNTFKDAKNILDRGRLVCFSGTPCQIYAFRKFLGRDFQNLILVDVVCRAVPSPGVWERYITYKEEKIGTIKSVRFRDKTLGYQYSTMCIRTDGGEELRGGVESDQWLRLFFSGMIIRPSCTNCVFRSPERISDFTIWDCFNIHRIDKSFNEDCGTTRVLIHTTKGKTLLNEINTKLLYKEVDYSLAVNNSKEFYESPCFDVLRDSFYKDYNTMEIEKLLNKYVPNSCIVKIKKMTRILLNKFGIDKTIKHVLKRG